MLLLGMFPADAVYMLHGEGDLPGSPGTVPRGTTRISTRAQDAAAAAAH